MKNYQSRAILFGAACCVASMSATAAVSADEAAKLGGELTPVGAIKAANADGTIPEWTNGSMFPAESKSLTPQRLEELRTKFEKAREKDPAPFEKLLEYVDSFSLEQYQEISDQVDSIIAKLPKKDAELAQQSRKEVGGNDKPKFIITAANMAEHADKLTEGHKAMFKKYPDTYKMIVYPTVRSAFFPDEIYEFTKKNATAASLEGTDNLKDAVLGFPFPMPQSGAEAIWNHKLKYKGSSVRRFNNQAIVKPDGDYKITKIVEDVKFKYGSLTDYKKTKGLLAYYLSEVLEPPRVAGQLTLVHEKAGADDKGITRNAWIFNPGLGRVNRAPDVSYDTPYIGTDGEQFTDQVDVFNGAMDRYNWKLVGRKEIYIPYNSYLINTPLIKYKDIIRPGHINQNLARYELHRVWVVEANVVDGQRHQIKKRVFYLDEDSWSIAVVDGYDNRGQLWKVQEAQLLTAPFVPTVTGIPEIIYDLQSGRYFVTALVNEDKISDFKSSYKDSTFSPSKLQKRARR